MKVAENTLHFAVNHFKNELKSLYDLTEVEQMMNIVFSHYFNLDRVDLGLKQNSRLSIADFQKITDVITALKTNKPLAQIIGEWEFYGISLKVNEHTLIPRPETEELVQLIVNENKDKEHLSVLDIGTGTGCIALALKQELPNINIAAYDISEEALKVATANAKKHELEITFNQIDILNWKSQNIKGWYDIIVSNPPYITQKERTKMHKNVLDYEPHLALFVENKEPLSFYDAIADYALNHLNKNGKLYFEINENYGIDVEQLLIDKKFKNINIVKDINEKDRIVSCNLD